MSNGLYFFLIGESVTLYWVDTGLVVGITIFLNTSYNWKACGKHDTKVGGYFFLCWNIVNNEYICFIFVYIKSIYTFFVYIFKVYNFK